MFDIEIAQKLDVSTEEYIKRIEKFEDEKMGEIIVAVLDNKIDKAKKLFNTI